MFGRNSKSLHAAREAEEARKAGEAAGRKVGQAVAAVLTREIKKARRRSSKRHKCLRCGAGPEWIE